MASKVSTQAFEKIYKKLNSKQREAVDAIEGPVMVVAGPGTGKTQILTLRIANILRKTDTAPENILAITFTESGVYSMRRRLVDIIGPEAYKVRISTFHGFANDVIKTYPESFPRIVGAATVTEIEQIKMIEEILDTGTFPKLRLWGDPYFYVRSILSQIRTLKRENITAADFAALVEKQKTEFEAIPDRYYESGRWQGQLKGVYQDEEKAIEKNRELATLFAAYESRLAKDRRYDYEDMILEVVRELSKKKDVLLCLPMNTRMQMRRKTRFLSCSQVFMITRICLLSGTRNRQFFVSKEQALITFYILGNSTQTHCSLTLRKTIVLLKKYWMRRIV